MAVKNYTFEAVANITYASTTAVFDIFYVIDMDTFLVTSASGSISYTGGTLVNSFDISLIPIGGFVGNDNIINDINNKPYYTNSGVSILDNTNNLSYNFFLLGSEDALITSDNEIDAITFEPGTEILYENCILENANILTIKDNKEISKKLRDLKMDDIIYSEGREHKIKQITYNSSSMLYYTNTLPYIIPKGILGATEDLYVSPGHAIKLPEGIFKLPTQLVNDKKYNKKYPEIHQCTLEELFNAGLEECRYMHVELERKDGETRRTNTLTINHVVTESLSLERTV